MKLNRWLLPTATTMKGFNFPAAACCENTATSDNAVPEVIAVPVMEAGRLHRALEFIRRSGKQVAQH
ncbi:hypothetical protein OIU77_017800 [Salix suchowensis]|uniref:Uncharacterized protein n=1 Tax=Salix suchowensis TaxID=1278906 RepID=A0ABQ8ZQ12_9ROSI|nr:hypothetical protein OIU77_017800 [Salix suchowensis]